MIFTLPPTRSTRKAPLMLPNACYCCCHCHVGGGGSGRCQIIYPRLPRPHFTLISPLALYLVPKPTEIHPLFSYSLSSSSLLDLATSHQTLPLTSVPDQIGQSPPNPPEASGKHLGMTKIFPSSYSYPFYRIVSVSIPACYPI